MGGRIHSSRIEDNMNRCRECNSVMTKTETVCLSCGSELEKKTGADHFGNGFIRLLSIMFFGSAALTIASLFFDATPPFSRCLICTLVLLVVRSSASQMQTKERS
jgi:hypothetical protein